MNKEAVSSAEEKEYRVVNLEQEYPDFVGDIKLAIVTDLDEEVLEKRFGAEIEQYKPFILLTTLAGEVFKTHKRNESKFEKRSQLYETLYAYEEGITELFHDELMVDTLFESIQEKLDKKRIASALKKLTEVQRRRVIMYFFEDFTIRNIAEIEGVDKRAIQDSINAAIRKLKGIIEE